jgi:TolA-binding protein
LASSTFGQSPDHWASQYASAVQLYDAERWQDARGLFEELARHSQGTPLELQASYFANECAYRSGDTLEGRAKQKTWLAQVRKLGDKASAVKRLADQLQFQLAIEKARAGHQAEAIEHLRGLTDATVSSDVRSAAWLELGWLELEQGNNPTGATDCFQKAQACQPASNQDTSPFVWARAVAAYAEGDMATATTWLQQLPDHHSPQEMAIRRQWLQAKIQRASGKLDQAIVQLRPLVELAAQGDLRARLIYDLASALLESSQSADADQHFRRLVQEYPSHPLALDARLRIARSLDRSGKLQEAVAMLEGVCAHDCPRAQQASAYLHRGALRVQLNQPAQAASDLEVALELYGEDAQAELAARFFLAEAMYLSQRWSDAQSHWQWLSDQVSDSEKPEWYPIILLRRAEMLAHQQRWPQAKSMASSILRDFPDFARKHEVHYLTARCMIAMAEIDAAREHLTRLATDPNAEGTEFLARSGWLMGETYFLQGDYARAIEHYRTVMTMHAFPNWQAAAMLQLGKCQEALENFTEAARIYSEITTGFSNSPYAPQAQNRLFRLRSAMRQNKLTDRAGTPPMTNPRR